MNLVHRLSMQEHTHGKGDIQRFWVRRVRRFFVQFYEACGFRVRLVSDGFALVELEEGGWINLA